MTTSTTTGREGFKARATRLALRAAMRAYLLGLRVLGRSRAPARNTAGPLDILLTLNFHAAGWPRALLSPLILSSRCGRLRLVTAAPVVGLDGVEVVHPPRWLRAVVGSTIARLMTFAWLGIRDRPDVVGGVHLLFNGLVASLVARAAGARSLWICVGGPNEVAGGGLWSENRVFGRLHAPDPVLEQRLVEATRSFDIIVGMGSGAAAFFQSRGASRRFHVVPSGVDAGQFQPGDGSRDVDLISVARLVPLKRIDLMVETVRKVADVMPDVRAVIIGDGPSRRAAEAMSEKLGIERNLTFLGHAPDVSAWLRRAKVFLLTSDTEGLSISLIEAMLSGAVPIVSNVGDLGDAVEHGVNGFLIGDRTPASFSTAALHVLSAPEALEQLSARARTSARQFDPALLARRWDEVLGDRALALAG